MKLFDWQWLVVSSLMVGALAAAETRPQYGGILRLAMRAAPASLDPAELDLRGNAQIDSFASRSLTGLMFDTLVTSDANGRIEPALATAWPWSALVPARLASRHGPPNSATPPMPEPLPERASRSKASGNCPAGRALLPGAKSQG